MKKRNMAIVATLGASTAVPAFAAFDYTSLTTGITEEVAAGAAFAGPAVLAVMGAMLGIKLAKRFFRAAT
ncbi:major capsid protein [Ferrimonas futtsuensis]|uniref:major capsid protein n=1 Tax=Ferrimonas futtsuensis TaxID=364764 RepID=UPI0003F75270|nr:major capsid protein [Ferrimonas futtsuensis]